MAEKYKQKQHCCSNNVVLITAAFKYCTYLNSTDNIREQILQTKVLLNVDPNMRRFVEKLLWKQKTKLKLF